MKFTPLTSLTLLALIALTVNCGSKANSPVDQQDKAGCTGIQTVGVAKFVHIVKSSSAWAKTDATISWTGRDGTVYDTRKYVLQTSDQCILDENLIEGSTTLVEAWVHCPVGPKTVQPPEMVPYWFKFLSLKSKSCAWTFGEIIE